MAKRLKCSTYLFYFSGSLLPESTREGKQNIYKLMPEHANSFAFFLFLTLKPCHEFERIVNVVLDENESQLGKSTSKVECGMLSRQGMPAAKVHCVS